MKLLISLILLCVLRIGVAEVVTVYNGLPQGSQQEICLPLKSSANCNMTCPINVNQQLVLIADCNGKCFCAFQSNCLVGCKPGHVQVNDCKCLPLSSKVEKLEILAYRFKKGCYKYKKICLPLMSSELCKRKCPNKTYHVLADCKGRCHCSKRPRCRRACREGQILVGNCRCVNKPPPIRTRGFSVYNQKKKLFESRKLCLPLTIPKKCKIKCSGPFTRIIGDCKGKCHCIQELPIVCHRACPPGQVITNGCQCVPVPPLPPPNNSVTIEAYNFETKKYTQQHICLPLTFTDECELNCTQPYHHVLADCKGYCYCAKQPLCKKGCHEGSFLVGNCKCVGVPQELCTPLDTASVEVYNFATQQNHHVDLCLPLGPPKQCKLACPNGNYRLVADCDGKCHCATFAYCLIGCNEPNTIQLGPCSCLPYLT